MVWESTNSAVVLSEFCVVDIIYIYIRTQDR